MHMATPLMPAVMVTNTRRPMMTFLRNIYKVLITMQITPYYKMTAMTRIMKKIDITHVTGNQIGVPLLRICSRQVYTSKKRTRA
jgi:hypothetical protein